MFSTLGRSWAFAATSYKVLWKFGQAFIAKK